MCTRSAPSTDHLNRFFGFAFAGWLPADMSVRTSCASLASLNSRRRAMFVRTSAALFASSSRIAGRSWGARRSLFELAVCREDSSKSLIPRSLVRFTAVLVGGHLGTFDPDPSVRKYLSANLPSRLCSGPPQLRQSNCRSRCEGGDSTRTTLYCASQFGHRNLAAVSSMENDYSDYSVP